MARARPYNEEEYVQSVMDRTATLSKYFSLKYERGNFERLAAKKRLQPRYIKFLNEAWQMLEELYPGRGDIHFELEPIFKEVNNTYGSNHVTHFKLFDKFNIVKVFIVIYWPELTLKNNKGHKITIKDLFTRIPVKLGAGSRGTMEFSRIEGTRTSMTEVEFTNQYLHSHLPRIDLRYNPEKKCEFQIFCTGVGDINSTTALLNSELDMDIVKLLLMQIETFLQWESLEGRPYIRMINVSSKDFKYSRAELSQCAAIYKSMIDKMVAGNIPDIDWKLYNGKFVITDNEKFEETLRVFLEYYLNKRQVFLFKNEQGEYYQESNQLRSVYEQSPEWIPFRGSKIHFKIDGEFKKAKQSDIKYLHPKIKHYVKQQLELKANSSKIRDLAINKQNTLAHTS